MNFFERLLKGNHLVSPETLEETRVSSFKTLDMKSTSLLVGACRGRPTENWVPSVATLPRRALRWQGGALAVFPNVFQNSRGL